MKLARVYKVFFFVATVILVASCLTTTIAQEVDDEKEFSYDEGSEIGPAHWGEIHEEWKDCKLGKMQSPVDMSNDRVQIVSHFPLFMNIAYLMQQILRMHWFHMLRESILVSDALAKKGACLDNFFIT